MKLAAFGQFKGVMAIWKYLNPVNWVKRNVVLSTNLKKFIEAFGDEPLVTEQTALKNTAVFACVRIISETLAWLPFPIYRRLQVGGKARAPAYPLYKLLQNKPNPEMTAFTFRETLNSHLMLWGNAYAYIEFDNGMPVALWPLPPNKVNPQRTPTGERFYEVTLPRTGEQLKLQPFRVLHIPGLGYDGTKGYSPIHLAKESVRLGLSTEKFGNQFFKNGMNAGSVVTHPQSLSDKAYDRLKKDLQEKHAGLGKAHMLMLLEEGMTFAKNTIPPNDAQFLETRKYQVTDIARIYRVPPHMLADLERASFSNIENQDLGFVKHTMMPYFKRWEQTVNGFFIPEEDQDTYFAEFLVDGILRGDSKSRIESYRTGRQWGWLSVNEIREMENMNPIDGGDQYLVPLNMTTPDKLGIGPDDPMKPDPPAKGGDDDDET